MYEFIAVQHVQNCLLYCTSLFTISSFSGYKCEF